MSSQQQPTFGFPRIFHALETLKSHLVSLQQGLTLAAQQQLEPPPPPSPAPQLQEPYEQIPGYPPGPPPAYGMPPSDIAPAPPARPSSALVPYTQEPPLSSSSTATAPQAHPHVYGHGYVQPGASPGQGGTSQQQILAQINAARAAIGPANTELDQAIAAMRMAAEDVYEWIGSNAAMGFPSMAVRDQGPREREAENVRDLERIAELERELNARPGCVVM